MIYYIFYELIFGHSNQNWWLVKGLNVFQYVTFRTAYASITALLISLLFGRRFINALKKWNIGQQIREEGPQAHIAKRDTPTMGGMLVIASVVISTMLWAKLSSLYVWVTIIATLAFGAVGFADDYLKLVKRRSLGLNGKQKLGAQFLIAIGVWAALFFFTGSSMIRGSDLKDPAGMASKLRDGRDQLSQYLRTRLRPDTQRTLAEYDNTATRTEAFKTAMVNDLNSILAGPSIYDEARFAPVLLSEETRKLVLKNPQGEDLVRLNRRLLQEAYPREIASSARYSWNVSIPFVKTTAFEERLTSVSYIGPYLYLVLVMVVLLGASNAVNLTDGLDGLAISITFIAMTALTAFTYLSSDARWAGYLDLTHRPEAAELTVFCGALAGASLGFLWFNAPPAEVFMGDVGSLAIGGAIGTIGVLTKQEFMLLMVGGVFVMEALSVMLQVSVFKMTKSTSGVGRRVFKMTPLHHHFEMVGWKEPKIVFRFLILAILFALLSLSTLKLR